MQSLLGPGFALLEWCNQGNRFRLSFLLRGISTAIKLYCRDK